MSYRTPSYRLHKPSGQAVVTIGNRDYYLGKWNTPESRADYDRLIAEWLANGRQAPASARGSLTINQLILAFWKHAEQHYRRPDGTHTNELNDFRLSLRPLRALYGHTAAKDFGPLALKAVRQKMIEADLCRGVINQRIGRVRRMFRWAVENELAPSAVLHGLEAVRGLQRGRSEARETEPVRPVPEQFVYAVLPFVRPQVAAMILLQLHTGMRPGEVVIMRAIDIDIAGSVWLYRPGSDQGQHGTHKTAHRGHLRVIPIGPRAQEIVQRYVKPDLYAYLFSPRDAVDHLRAEQRTRRKTKVQPSQVNRRRKTPRRKPGDRYRVGSYALAIARACVKADEHAHHQNPEIPADQIIVPHWHPHQLRHTKATQIRRDAGLDAARAVLGHRSPQVTEVYAEIDTAKAAEVMAKLG
jgi:integrase